MVIYARSEANRKVQIDKPSNLNLKRKPRGTAELETGGRQLKVAPVTRSSGSGERTSRKAEVPEPEGKHGNRRNGRGKRQGRKKRSRTAEPTVRGKREEGKRRNRGRVVRC